MTILTELTEFKNVKESHQLPRLKKKNPTQRKQLFITNTNYKNIWKLF